MVGEGVTVAVGDGRSVGGEVGGAVGASGNSGAGIGVLVAGREVGVACNCSLITDNCSLITDNWGVATAVAGAGKAVGNGVLTISSTAWGSRACTPPGSKPTMRGKNNQPRMMISSMLTNNPLQIVLRRIGAIWGTL